MMLRLLRKELCQVQPHPPQPTVYQIGAVPHAPDVGRAFDLWAARTGLGENERPLLERLDIRPKQGWPAIIRLMDMRDAVWGAIVFEEKARVLAQGSELFTQVRPDAALLGEINTVIKVPDGLVAANSGPAAAELSLDLTLGSEILAR